MTEADFAIYAAARDALTAAAENLRKAVDTCESLTARCTGLSNAEMEPMKPEMIDTIMALLHANSAVAKAYAVHRESLAPFYEARRRRG